MPLIERFFAVTRKAVYKIERDAEGAFVQKTHMREGAESDVKIGDVLQRLPRLAVTVKMGIFPYDCVEKPEEVPTAVRKYMAGTSSVVALFTHQEPALECFYSDAENIQNPQWKAYTQLVLHALKDDPIIKVSHDPITGFPPEFFST